MEISYLFIGYLTIVRVAMIICGIVCIYFGYKLFVAGVGPDINNINKTAVDAEIMGSRFSIRNAAPGTCFALFGVIIISIMFLTGGPSLTLKNLEHAQQLVEKSRDSDLLLHLRTATLTNINRVHSDYTNGYINAENAYKQLYEIVTSMDKTEN